MNRYWLLSCVLSLPLATAGAASPAPEFERDVLPILTNQCLNCHGGLRQKGGLDLRTVAAMTKGGKSGAVVDAGKPEQSLLWQKVAGDEMPKTLLKLSADEKRVLKDWIAAGLPRSPSWPQLLAGRAEAPATPGDVAKRLDESIEERLQRAKLTPAPLANDAEFLRRVSLDLTGRLPAPEQVRAFLADPAVDKRARLVDELLARPEFGRHWGLQWHHLLTPLADGKRVYDPALWDWLARAFNEGRKWDQVVADLITAQSGSDASAAVNFLAAHKDPDKMGARSANLFLGVNMECAECHDHPHTRWKQKDDYWALAAFFSQVKAGRKGNVTTLTEAAPSPKGLQIRIPTTALVNGGATIWAGFPGVPGVAPPATGPARAALARWLTGAENPYFAAAAVNRTWAHFFGRGLINPVDDLHEGNPATHPDVLALLVREFRAAGHDLRHLVRCVTRTRAYQRTSCTDREDDGQEALYARMPVRLLSPDTLYDVLVQVLEVPELTIPGVDPKPARGAPPASPRQLFVNTFRQGEAANPREYDHGVLQILPLVNWRDFNAGGRVVPRLVGAKLSPEQAVEELYLRSLSRRPTAAETEKVLRYLGRQADRQAALASVLWLLLNSSEFVFNH